MVDHTSVRSHHTLPGRSHLQPARQRLNDPLCSERVTMHCQWGRKPAKTAPSPLDFATQLQEETATAIGNTQRKIIDKDRACDSGDILADRQTDRQTHEHTCSSQYFVTAPAGKVKKHSVRKFSLSIPFAAFELVRVINIRFCIA